MANLFRLLGGRRVLAPLVVSYCVTAHCNLNCRYCEDFGARRNAGQPAPLPLAEACRLLDIIRQAAGSLIFSGGEPLLHPHIDALLAYARRQARFRHLSVITNGTLLDQHPALLDHVDRLVVSLDSVEPDAWDQTLGAGPGTAARILDNVALAARQQRARGFRLIAHCVVRPDSVEQARGVLDFCLAHKVGFSVSPQSVNNWPHYDLLGSEPYRAFLADVIRLKRRGAPIVGSLAYLSLMLKFEPFACYPLLAPRVMPEGTLAYPCRPVERGADAHGGREISLLESQGWQAALARAVERYGVPPLTCGSCYQQCYVEPSLMQARPAALAWELLACAPSRYARIHTYAPG